MVDIHCHIVPGVDDGARDLETALAMIAEAEEQGVTAILTTPHIRGWKDDLPILERQREAFEPVLAQGGAVSLKLGCEVRVTSETSGVLAHSEFTSNRQGKYMLLEMPFDSIPQNFYQLLFGCQLAGITPIVAHPERNVGVLQKPETALEFVKRGARLQLTNSSLLGDLGESFQQAALAMLEAGLVSIVASDAHNTSSRPFTNWKSVHELLSELESEWRERGEAPFLTDQVCISNPQAVFDAKPMRSIDLEEIGEEEIRKRLSSAVRKPGVKRKRFFFF